MMLVKPEIFELHKVAGRYALGGVRFERDATGQPVAVATDGRVMLAARWVETAADEYPADKTGLATELVPGFGCIVPIDACKKAVKLPPKRTNKAVLRNVLLDEPATNGAVPMAATDLEAVDRLEPAALEGRYPKWRDVYPRNDQAERTVSVKLGGRLLADLLQSVIKASGERDPKVVVTFNLDAERNQDGDRVLMAARAQRNPVFITAEANDTQLAGVIMPVAVDDNGKPIPSSWPLLPVWVPGPHEAEKPTEAEKPAKPTEPIDEPVTAEGQADKAKARRKARAAKLKADAAAKLADKGKAEAEKPTEPAKPSKADQKAAADDGEPEPAEPEPAAEPEPKPIPAEAATEPPAEAEPTLTATEAAAGLGVTQYEILASW